MSAEFDALKAAAERLIAAYKLKLAETPDPNPADIAALTAEINGILPPA